MYGGSGHVSWGADVSDGDVDTADMCVCVCSVGTREGMAVQWSLLQCELNFAMEHMFPGVLAYGVAPA